MLVSPNVDERQLFLGVRAVIIDEIHAFAGDDRGWHLLAVLERVKVLAGIEFQRVGLSATVGNARDLLDWLAGSCSGQRQVFEPRAAVQVEADVQLDFDGSLEDCRCR
jgi:ATP-dependent Lhr-like helicase